MMWLLSLLPTKAAIKAFFRSWRPEMYALVAVIAVAGIATAIIGNLYISGQKDRIARQSDHIARLTEINKDWQAGYERQVALRENDRKVVLELQEHAQTIEAQAAKTEQQLVELRRTNEQIRNYLDQPIPDGIERVRR